MKHPDDELWVSWLFKELDAERSRELAAHRRLCPDCDRRVRSWEQALRVLGPKALPTGSRSWLALPSGGPPLRWAVAAAVLLFGLLAGWMTRSASAGLDEARWRAELQTKWDEQFQSLRTELLADVAAQLQSARAADSATFMEALTDLQAGYVSQISALREDLEVMAFNTRATLEVAEQKLVRLEQDPLPGAAELLP